VRPIRLVIVLACLAWAAAAQCRPEGRSTFAAGLRALADGDLPAAAARFDALVRTQPDCVDARNNLAAVEVQQGKFSEAAEQLRRVIQLRPDYQRARANLQRVEALLAKTPAPSPATATPTPTAQATA
jgi:tetratricopeptide (TPR) repeat protein